MLERTAYRILPIIQEVANKMINSKDKNDKASKVDINENLKQKLNMKAILGYLN